MTCFGNDFYWKICIFGRKSVNFKRKKAIFKIRIPCFISKMTNFWPKSVNFKRIWPFWKLKSHILSRKRSVSSENQSFSKLKCLVLSQKSPFSVKNQSVSRELGHFQNSNPVFYLGNDHFLREIIIFTRKCSYQNCEMTKNLAWVHEIIF